MPFAALLALVAAHVAVVLWQLLMMKLDGSYSTNGWFFKFVLPLFAGTAAGYAFIWTAAAVAPRAKLTVSIVMATLLIAWSVWAIPSEWMHGSGDISEHLKMTIDISATAIGAIFGVIKTSEENKRNAVS